MSVTAGEVRRLATSVEGMRPALLFAEAIGRDVHDEGAPRVHRRARQAGHHRPRQRADRPLARRGLRLRRARPTGASPAASRSCASTPEDNGYARPIEGLIVHFDLGRDEVHRGHRPRRRCRCRRATRATTPSDHEPLRTDLKPLEITQPEGPSFTVDGNLVRWQKWSLRIGFDPYEGLVLHQVDYDDDGREPLDPAPRVDQRDGRALRRPGPAARLEERVRRGRVGPRPHDASRSRSGATASARSTTSTRCSPTSRASRRRSSNAICLHEEDYGILWKHVDLFSGHERGAPQPPARRQLDRDRRQLRVRLLLVLLPRRQHPARGEAHRHRVADGDRAGTRARVRRTSSRPGVAAPHHQHLFNVRLDFDVDGADNEVYEVEAEPLPPGPTTRGPTRSGQRRHAARRRERRRSGERRRGATSRAWKVVEPARAQRARPAGGVQARADDEHADAARAARLARRQARRLRPPQPLGHAVRARRAAGRGRVPEPARGRRRAARAGPPPTASLADTDVVLWYTFGVTHFVRPEDWPVMPVEYTGFLLTPVGLLRPQPRPRRPPVEQRPLRLNA